jgi:hypothetical protein
MRQCTLTVIDASGVQDYIFGTNNLKQNVGASYLVECATRGWAVEALPRQHNVTATDGDTAFTDQRIEDGELKAEVLYAGGGNTAIVFASRDLAIDFAHRLSRRVLSEAPGLRLNLVHHGFDWDTQALGGSSGAMKVAFDLLLRQKEEQSRPWPTLGLSVTAACVYTGLPAVDEVGEDEDRHPVSAEVVAKLEAERPAHDRLKKIISFHGYDVPKDLDDFGRTRGESSYIAVVHCDGNGMGKRIQEIRDSFTPAGSNRRFVAGLRTFSESIRTAALNALRSAAHALAGCVVEKEGKRVIAEVIEIRDNKLPLRPIVFGGDDVTFVCDGRLGLGLAAYYLREFSRQKLADGQLAHCRAGIAVVKAHYPFASAYRLADALCGSAKAYIRERQQPPHSENGLTAMDWHFATAGLSSGLEEIRRRQYTVNAEKLLMRPVRLTDPDKHWRSWDTFRRLALEFQGGEQWAARRNKVRSLREALRAGPDAVRHFCKVYDTGPLPRIHGQPDMSSQGWQGGRCGYFDAIEAMEFVIPIGEDMP